MSPIAHSTTQVVWSFLMISRDQMWWKFTIAVTIWVVTNVCERFNQGRENSCARGGSFMAEIFFLGLYKDHKVWHFSIHSSTTKVMCSVVFWLVHKMHIKAPNCCLHLGCLKEVLFVILVWFSKNILFFLCCKPGIQSWCRTAGVFEHRK